MDMTKFLKELDEELFRGEFIPAIKSKYTPEQAVAILVGEMLEAPQDPNLYNLRFL